MRLSGQDGLARLLSNLFHPFLVSAVTLPLVIYLDGAALLEALWWSAVGFVIVILPLTLYLAFNVRSGRYSDWSISIREQRHTIYLLAGVCFVIVTLTFHWGGAPAIALACLYAALLALVIAALINRFTTKISLHSISMAGCATAFFWFAPLLGLFAAVAAVAVGWARMRLRHHTLSQVIAAWALAAGSVLLVFGLYL
jgi:membrane-associated phospholipid phosphatase